jgi:hypothetical protein
MKTFLAVVILLQAVGLATQLSGDNGRAGVVTGFLHAFLMIWGAMLFIAML